MATYQEAAKHILSFGSYCGQAIDKIAESDEGLKYLDWAKGVDAGNTDDRVMIHAYLMDPTIAKELDNIT